MSNIESLSVTDWAEIKRITRKIVEVIPATARTERLEHEIGRILADEVLSASAAYSAKLATEDTHESGSTHQWDPHPISECSPDFCGRYWGQRRNSARQSDGTCDHGVPFPCGICDAARMEAESLATRMGNEWAEGMFE